MLRCLLVAAVFDVLLGAWVLRTAPARNVLRYRAPAKRWVVPVAGVQGADLVSTWGAPRPGGRRHRGIDIFAEKGTPVVAATDGVVVQVGRDGLGGNVVWILGEGLQVHYYAHLDEWAPGLEAGRHVKAGEAIGTVGNTGNARTTPPHLHFSLSRVSWSRFARVAYDPEPVLRGAETIR